MSTETTAKQPRKDKGQKRSDEARQKMSAAALLRTDRHSWSEEVRQKMAEGQKKAWARRKNATVTSEG